MWLAVHRFHETKHIVCTAAPHSKSGMTIEPKLADRNQQDTLPHLRLMEWVWNYFVDSSTDPDAHKDASHKSATRAGAVHAQPSKQDSGSSHWQGQEDDQSRKQQTAPSSSCSGASRHVISKTGECRPSLCRSQRQGLNQATRTSANKQVNHEAGLTPVQAQSRNKFADPLLVLWAVM